MDGFRHCKFSTGCGYEVCMPEFCDAYGPKIETNADHIRAMSDEELSWYLAKKFADYAAALYNGSYTPSDEVVHKMALELLRQLQQPHEEECL